MPGFPLTIGTRVVVLSPGAGGHPADANGGADSRTAGRHRRRTNHGHRLPVHDAGAEAAALHHHPLDDGVGEGARAGQTDLCSCRRRAAASARDLPESRADSSRPADGEEQPAQGVGDMNIDFPVPLRPARRDGACRRSRPRRGHDRAVPLHGGRRAGDAAGARQRPDADAVRAERAPRWPRRSSSPCRAACSAGSATSSTSATLSGQHLEAGIHVRLEFVDPPHAGETRTRVFERRPRMSSAPTAYLPRGSPRREGVRASG